MIRRRRTRRLALVLALAAAGRALLPYGLEAGAEIQASRALGRVVEVDNIDLALYRGGLVLEGLRIGGAYSDEGAALGVSDDAAIFALSRIVAELSWWDLLRGRVHLRALELGAPKARLEHREDGSLTPLVLRETQAGAPRDAESEADAWPLLLDRFLLRDARLSLTYAGEQEVEFQLAEFSLAELAYRDRKLSLGAVGLREPQVRVHRDLAVGERPIGQSAPVAAGTTTAPATPSTPNASPPGHRVAAIDIERAEFTLVTDDAPLAVAIALSAKEVTVDPGQTFPLTLHLEMAGGSLDVAGEVGVAPPRFVGSVEWDRVGFPVLSQALGLELPIRVVSVLSSGSLEVDADLGEGERAGRLTFSGVLRAEDVEAVVRATAERLQLESIALGIDEFEMPLGAIDSSAALARLSGETSAERVSFVTPDGELAVGVTRVGAKAIHAAIPLAGSTGVLRMAAQVRAEEVDVEVGAGDEIDVGVIELALAELVVPNGDEDLTLRAGLSAKALAFASAPRGVRTEISSLSVEDVVAVVPAALADNAARIQTGTIRIGGPRVALRRSAASAPEPAGREEPTEGGETPPPVVRVAGFEVRDGVVEWVDETVEPFAKSTVEGIALTASEIRWPERGVGRFELRSRGPAQATFRASGALGPVGEIDWALASLQLPHFNPYAKPVGYRVEGGAAGLEGSVALSGGVVAVDSQLVLDQLDLETHRSEEFEDQIGVPLGLAVGLLKDPSGRISFPVRFEAERDEVRAQLLPLILATLRHALVGAVTLPLKALQGLVPGGGSADFSLPVVASAPGASAPDPAAGESVEALATLLAERPALGLVIRGQTGPNDEGPLALAMLVERLRADQGLPESVEVGFFARRRLGKALREHGEAAREALDEDDTALLEQAIAATAVTDRDRNALADQRAAALRATLVERYGVAAARIRLAPAALADAGGSAPELVAIGALPEPRAPAVAAPPPPGPQ